MARTRESDPLTELATLEAALKRAGLARGYVLRGEERYFRERAIAGLKGRAEALGYETCTHDAERENPDFQLARLLDDLAGGALFAARRLVVVRHPGELLQGGAEESPLVRAVCAFVRSAQDAGTVVLSDASLRVDHPAAKAIAGAGGALFSFRRLYDTPPPWNPDQMPEVVLWVQRRARELGQELAPEQALYVAAATGNDLFALDDRLELLRASGSRDLRAAVPWTSGASPWAVADRILDGDLPRGLAGIEALFAAGFQDKGGRRVVDGTALATMLVSSLQRGAREALELSTSLERRAPPGDALAGSGTRRGGEGAALARARARPSAHWRELLEEVAALERAVKSLGGADANDLARLALRWSLRGERRAR